MDKIYSRASRVLVWLGESDPEVENAMSAVQEWEPDENLALQESGPEYRGLTKMLKKAWWHRTWVIQELVLASQNPLVGCGNTWLEWDKVSKALINLSGSMMDDDRGWIREGEATWDADPLLINQFALLRNHWKDGSVLSRGRLTFIDVLVRTREHESTDSRDQIFSIWGLLGDKDRAIVPAPSYEKSVSQVYQETMIAIFKSSRHLEFLVHAPEGHQMELPSWCADFSKTSWDWESYFVGDGYRREEEHEITDDVFTHDLRSISLKVTGRILGKVVYSAILTSKFTLPGKTNTKRGQGHPSDRHQQKAFQDEVQGAVSLETFIHQVLNFTVAAYKGFELRYGREKALKKIAAGQVWETICKCYPIRFLSRQACARVGIKVEDEEDMPKGYESMEAFVREAFPWYKEALQKFGLYRSTHDMSERVGIRRALSHTLILTVQECFGRSWFVTNKGNIGRAEKEILETDRLCIISGCSAPFILRPCDEDSFRIVSMIRSTDRYEADFRDPIKELETREFVLL